MRRAAHTESDPPQLGIFGDPAAQARLVDDLADRQQGRAEFATFERQLRTEKGLQPATALSLKRQLQAATDAAGVPSPSRFVQEPALVVAGIERLATRGARLTLHRAVGYFLSLFEKELPPGTAERCDKALAAFPARVSPKLHLVDRDLGGSVKRTRPAPPFGAGEAAHLYQVVEATAPPGRRAREVALLALEPKDPYQSWFTADREARFGSVCRVVGPAGFEPATGRL